jgi:phosphatidylglycerol:prolipoprotein diacylglycerol transferase
MPVIVFNINPVLLSVGPFTVRWYGLMYVVGIAVGLVAAWPYARSRGLTQAQFERVVWWSVPAGLIGARLYFVAQQPLGPYIAEPWRILAFWEGGMAFYGAVFAVVLVIIVLALRKQIPFWTFLDAAAIFGVVGQFFGRIGNLINGDVIGYPTTLPWGIIYAHPNSFAPSHDTAYHPAAIYEALSNVILFGILWALRERLRTGMLFFTYIMGYSLSQIVVFFWRDNVTVAFGLKQAQLTAIAVMIGALIVFIVERQRRKRGPGLSSPSP